MKKASGLVQTGIVYPRASNVNTERHVAIDDGELDSSTIEFDCRKVDLDFNPNEYRLTKIIIYDN